MFNIVSIQVYTNKYHLIKYKKSLKGDAKGNIVYTLLYNTYTISMGGKILLGYYSETSIKECSNCLFCPIYYLYYISIFL